MGVFGRSDAGEERTILEFREVTGYGGTNLTKTSCLRFAERVCKNVSGVIQTLSCQRSSLQGFHPLCYLRSPLGLKRKMNVLSSSASR